MSARTTAETLGLTEAEAAQRLRKQGPNRVSEAKRRPVMAFVAKFSGPVPWMLEATLVLEAALHKWIETAVVFVLIALNAVLSFVQEHRARSALALLRQRLAVMARVVRDGRWTRVDAEGIVPGDVLRLRMGDFVPADLRVIDGDLLVDASSLTGESAPVEVRAGDAAHAGSVVRRGEATAEVTATGSQTYFGRTAELVQFAKSKSHLEALIVGIVKVLVLLDGALAAAVFVVAAARSVPLWDVVPFVLMLLVASVPVALPATFTLASALGGLELSADGVLVTRLSAVEEAAAMQVLCSDKTGTLTQNRLTLAAVRPRGACSSADVVRLASYASAESTQDPLDLAILSALDQAAHRERVERLRFVPFDPATKRAEAAVRQDGRIVRVVKGAPDVVAALCGVHDVDRDVGPLAANGDRVLAIAAGPEDHLELVGLLGFHDPIREDSRQLIEDLRRLGVRVIMVTGDTAATAVAAARQLGIGERVGARDDVDRPSQYDVFAGVLPEHKFHLVKALQGDGAVIGMTGDGVNDAPALKQAEVGIAVESAADVAKAAASFVLTRPGLAGVVAAVETGRRIYQRMLTYTLNKIVKTIQISLFLAVGFFTTGEFLLTPRLILLLLFTNDFVTMSIASDRVSYSATPDRWNVRILVRGAAWLAVAWLVFSLAVLFAVARSMHLALPALQTAAFLLVVFGGQANVYLVRERRHFWRSRPSAWMLGATLGDGVFVAALALTGALMAPVGPWLLAGLLAAVLVFMGALDVAKVKLLGG